MALELLKEKLFFRVDRYESVPVWEIRSHKTGLHVYGGFATPLLLSLIFRTVPLLFFNVPSSNSSLACLTASDLSSMLSLGHSSLDSVNWQRASAMLEQNEHRVFMIANLFQISFLPRIYVVEYVLDFF